MINGRIEYIPKNIRTHSENKQAGSDFTCVAFFFRMYPLELESHSLNFYEDLSNRIFNIDLLYPVLFNDKSKYVYH